ncbi:MAG: sugar phosphate isomerase/epimerase [Planctomycetota bacterium]
MIKLGVNTVLFNGHNLETAMKHIAWAGYDGVELSAIRGMCEHVELDRWADQVDEIKALSDQYGLALLAMEKGGVDAEWVPRAIAAAAALGVPVVNVGPGGKADDGESFEERTDLLAKMADLAAEHGVTLCCKAHVNASIYSTPTTLRATGKIKSPAFGVDMDPSHIHRAGENPAEALPEVLDRVRHVHIRDCKGPGPSPGAPRDQACGRGDIDLWGYFKAMVDGGYDGPVDLEIIGAGDYPLARQAIIAAESYGYMNACLKALGAR